MAQEGARRNIVLRCQSTAVRRPGGVGAAGESRDIGGMSRTKIATVAGLLFVTAYVVAVVTLPDLFPRMHWALEAAYWLTAGVVWVFPIRWLMMWSVGKR